MRPKLKPPGTKRLKLNCAVLLSTSTFKFSLRRYIKRGDLVIIQGVTGTDAHRLNKQHTVGTSTSTASGSFRIRAQPTLNRRT
jgi:hypothetical protein